MGGHESGGELGWMDQVEEEMFLANLTHIVVELSFPKGYHLTLIKVGRRGTAERKRMAVFPPWEKALRRD